VEVVVPARGSADEAIVGGEAVTASPSFESVGSVEASSDEVEVAVCAGLVAAFSFSFSGIARELIATFFLEATTVG